MHMVRVAALALALAGLAGCGAGTSPGDLDNLSEDANNNGYLDVTPPDGVEFSSLTNVNVRLHNTIDTGDLAVVAQNYGIDPSLLALATITAHLEIGLDYGANITDTLHESEEIAPFDKKFEIACPEMMDVYIYVTAAAPIIGEQVLFEETYSLVLGQDYECAEAVGFETYVSDSGFPAVDRL